MTTCTSDSNGTGDNLAMYTVRSIFYYIDNIDYRNPGKNLDKFLKKLKIFNSQWILRNGFKLKFYPLQFNLPPVVIFFRKILRCNRKGMGLRLRRDN